MLTYENCKAPLKEYLINVTLKLQWLYNKHQFLRAWLFIQKLFMIWFSIKSGRSWAWQGSQTQENFKMTKQIEYWSVTSSIFIFAVQLFHDQISVQHDEKPLHTKFYMNRLWWPEIWQHEYLISPIQSSVNWPGSYQYSCGHISGPCELIPTKFGL